jgi:hypothetical protein
MIAGTLVVWCLPTRTATWFSLLFLLAIHLMMNHAAVRAVKMRSLNRQRANMLFSNLVERDRVLTPEVVSEKELIFERFGGGVFRWMSDAVMGHCDFGVSLQTLLNSLPKSHRNTASGSTRLEAVDLSTVMNLFRNQQYILWCQTCTPRWYSSKGEQTKVLVVLKQGVTPESQLRAWYHALLLARRLSSLPQTQHSLSRNVTTFVEPSPEDLLLHVASTLKAVTRTFDGYIRRLRAAGWNPDVSVLETRSGSRIFCESKASYAKFLN